MLTEASVAGGASLANARNLTIEATGNHDILTKVEGGAAAPGGTAVTPVIGISVAQNTVSAALPVGDALSIGGDLVIKATLDADTATEAKGSADATNAAVGASLGLTMTFDNVSAALSRSLTTGGAVLVSARSLATSRTDARASAKGAASETGNETSNGTDVQRQTNQQVGEGNSRTSGGRSAGSPDTSTSDGQVSVAAAIAINIADTDASASIAGTSDTPISVTAGGAVTVKSEANADASARGDGKAAANAADATTVGAAVAVNASDVDYVATVDHVALTGQGINVQALIVERDVDFEASELETVDTEADTIFVGSPEKAFTTGEKVRYKNGGGTNIEGLTDGTDYYVILADNGRIKLAASLGDAQSGKAIDLKSQGSGDAHQLERTEAGATAVTFDPDAKRYEIEFDNPSGLQTGEAVVYDTDGTAIGGLTDGTTYYAIVESDGRLKLAESREKALKGEAIELTGTGSGDHALKEAAHSAGATAISGAAGGKTGVAGSVAINVSLGDATADVGSGANLTVTGAGASSVNAETATYSLTRAIPNTTTTGTSTGVGLSFAIGISDHDALASVSGEASLIDLGDLAVKAKGDHVEVTKARAGVKSNGGTAVGGALALTVSLNDTDALISAGGTALDMDGDLVVSAASTLEQQTEADADTKGGETGVGIALAMGWADDDTSALLARSVSTGGTPADDVTVAATSKVTAKTVATGSSEGGRTQSDGGNTADGHTQSNTNFAGNRSGASLSDPNAGGRVGQGNSTAQTQTSNPGGQGGTGQQASTQTQAGTVRVAGAIGATIIVPSVTAVVADGVTINASGAMEVKAESEADATTEASGLALDSSTGKTGVGAAVAVNVAVMETQALVGTATITAASLTVRAGTPAGETNELKTLALAGAGVKQKSDNGSGNTNGGTAVAGAAGVNYYETDTDAAIGDGASINATAGDVNVVARESVGIQNIAGGGALLIGSGGSDGGTSVGAAVGVNILTTSTEAGIGANAEVDATGNSAPAPQREE